MWLIYINDLLLELESSERLINVYAYADDIMVFCENIVAVRRVISIIRKWSISNHVKMNNKKSAILPLVRRKSKKDKFGRSILDIPIVREYKYLGLTLSYDMSLKQTLTSLSIKVRNMRSHKVLGTPEMSMRLRLNVWKTYFYSKLLYPILTLRLQDKTCMRKLKEELQCHSKIA